MIESQGPKQIIFTPPTTLAGVVVDEAGKPVADAEGFDFDELDAKIKAAAK